MIDLKMIDQLYEISQQTGCAAVESRVFDKRALLPLEQVPGAVQSETGEAVTVDELRELAVIGWFPLLALPDSEHGLGAPFYAFSRAGLFLKLRREGFTDSELRVYAEYEESMIDGIYTQDELAYLDDDLETLIRYSRARIDAGDIAAKYQPFSKDEARKLERERQELKVLERWKAGDVAPSPKIHKFAYRVRWANESIRFMLHRGERGMLEAGYSPFLSATLSRYKSGQENTCELTGIRWAETLHAAFALFDGDDAPPIRLPGFVLRGERVLSTRTLPPTEYERTWSKHDLDSYLHAWSELRGERRCLACLNPLPVTARVSKRFCSDRCRNMEKQRRFRERHPDAAERARRRYLQSLEDME